MACRKNSPGKPCCCCNTIELPNETWVQDSECCIRKVIDVNPDDTWHYVCSGNIKTCTQSQSVDIKLKRHLWPVVEVTYTGIEPDPIECIPGGDCTIEGVVIPPCDDSTIDCGTVSLSATQTTTHRLVVKYRHLRDIITISKVFSQCVPDTEIKCKYLVSYSRVVELFYGQVAFGSLTKNVSSLSGCCRVESSTVSAPEISCEAAAVGLTNAGEVSLIRSKVYDDMPSYVSLEKGAMASCVPYPVGPCAVFGVDGPVVCSADLPIATVANATCGTGTSDVGCYAIIHATGPANEEFCQYVAAYPSERHHKTTAIVSSPILPGYLAFHDNPACVVECGETDFADGILSSTYCENLVNSTSCTEYTSQCIDLFAGDWSLSI